MPERRRRVDPNLLPSPEELEQIELRKQQVREEHMFRKQENLENYSDTHRAPFTPRIFRFSPMRGSQNE